MRTADVVAMTQLMYTEKYKRRRAREEAAKEAAREAAGKPSKQSSNEANKNASNKHANKQPDKPMDRQSRGHETEPEAEAKCSLMRAVGGWSNLQAPDSWRRDRRTQDVDTP